MANEVGVHGKFDSLEYVVLCRVVAEIAKLLPLVNRDGSLLRLSLISTVQAELEGKLLHP